MNNFDHRVLKEDDILFDMVHETVGKVLCKHNNKSIVIWKDIPNCVEIIEEDTVEVLYIPQSHQEWMIKK